MKRVIASAILFVCLGVVCGAQKCVMKTNMLYWATTTPNIGLEGAVSPNWTMGLEVAYNPWEFGGEKNIKTKHILVSPELRYWFCEPFFGHFMGLHSNLIFFNVGSVPFPAFFYPNVGKGLVIDHLNNSRCEGYAASFGLEYGCSWPISRCWNFEFNIGLGFWYTYYDRYEARSCGIFNDTVSKIIFGPTSLGASFVYIIK